VQPPDLSGAKPEQAREDRLGVLAQLRRPADRDALGARKPERRARHAVGADLGMLDVLPHRVIGPDPRILLDQLPDAEKVLTIARQDAARLAR
jgi:hypothetical protein